MGGGLKIIKKMPTRAYPFYDLLYIFYNYIVSVIYSEILFLDFFYNFIFRSIFPISISF
jgi:hypothetical protein